jgi:hypothetical protein
MKSSPITIKKETEEEKDITSIKLSLYLNIHLFHIQKKEKEKLKVDEELNQEASFRNPD